MRVVPGSRALYSIQRTFQNDINTALEGLVGQLTAEINRFATSVQGDRSIIPPEREREVLQRTGDAAQRFFVGADFRQPYGADGVTPTAAFPEWLNIALGRVTLRVVDAQARFMRARLPDDILRWLTSSPAMMEMSNPLATYQPAHTWVDARGYRLSDRIWQTSIATRSRIDALLADGIRSGRSAFDMARDLEPFLLPNRANLRTTKPYGSNASYDAMRLARSEISRAHSWATYISGAFNPFADGMDWALSAKHPKIDICDKFATIGMDGSRLREPYPMNAGYVPLVLVDSHPNCLCVNRLFASRSPSEVVEELRQRMNNNAPPPLTPVNRLPMLQIILGAAFAKWVNDRMHSQRPHS